MASSKLNKDFQDIKVLAESDLAYFIKLVAPYRILGNIHKQVVEWWTRPQAKNHQLLLLPRDHGKSAMIAYRAAWEITKNPAITILYISATENLAKKQVRKIKDILTSPIYRDFWPDMVFEEEGKREKWTETEICVDHPKRKVEGIRDSTLEAGGITKNITGLHCNICILDDVVVPENAYTEEGRRKVADLYSFLSSIESAEAHEWVVGTRYYAKDLYDYLQGLSHVIFDDEGNIKKELPVYEVFERVVENSPERDGSGQYLWPRQRTAGGKHFGFTRDILELKKAKYVDKAKFYAQYYNDPTDPGSERIDSRYFQYYEPKFLSNENGRWVFKGKVLEIYAGMDFAWSLNTKADYSAVAVIGITHDSDIYVLEIDRFKTDQLNVMWDHLIRVHNKWGIKKVQTESNMGQKVIINQFKNYAVEQGSTIKIEDVYRTRNEGTKQERNTAILQPRYAQRKIWHYKGYNCQVLEEEVTSNFPEHDDVEDSFASAVEIAKPNKAAQQRQPKEKSNMIYHPRFGGIAA